MKVLKACYVVLAAVCALSLVTAAISAQDSTKDQPAAAEKEAPKDTPSTESPNDPVAEWKQMFARMNEIQQQLAQLQGEFNEAASDPEKLKIRRQFQALIADFQANVEPRMKDLAPKVYEMDDKQFEAGEFVIQSLMQKNEYAKALAIADKLSAAGHKSPSVTWNSAVSNFALSNFEKSKSILDEADKEGMLNPQGKNLQKDAGEYVELWKKEQTLREAEDKAAADKQNPRVEIKTNRGKIVAELFEDQAPNTVANFISLIENKTYDGSKFHRVIPNFMIQGGDPNSKDDNPANDGQGGPGYAIDCETEHEGARQHFRGSLSMAHAGKNTGGSQFFITHQPTPHLNGMHTVFGRVIEGQEVVDATQKDDTIESATVVRKRDHEYKPVVHEKTAPGGLSQDDKK